MIPLKTAVALLAVVPLFFSKAPVAQSQALLIERFSSMEEGAKKGESITVRPVVPASTGNSGKEASKAGPWVHRYTERDWTMECMEDEEQEAAQKCRMKSQSSIVTDKGRSREPNNPFLITVEQVEISKGEIVAVVVVRTPMNILISQGVTLAIDGSELGRLAIRSCHADLNYVDQTLETMCLAPLPLADEFLERFKKGFELEVSAKMLSGTSINQKVSLLGFTSVFSRMNTF